MDQSRLWDLFKKAKRSHREAASGLKHGTDLAQDLLTRPGDAVRQLLLDLVKQVVVQADRIVTELKVGSLLKRLAVSSIKQADSTITLTATCRFCRRGRETRLVFGDRSDAEDRPDATLIAALVREHAWWQELCGGKVQTIKELADRESSDERYVARVLKLAFLAPDITAAILDGRQPPHITADALIKMTNLPCSWKMQREGSACDARAARAVAGMAKAVPAQFKSKPGFRRWP